MDIPDTDYSQFLLDSAHHLGLVDEAVWLSIGEQKEVAVADLFESILGEEDLQ